MNIYFSNSGVVSYLIIITKIMSLFEKLKTKLCIYIQST